MWFFNILQQTTQVKDTCDKLFTPEALNMLNELLSYFKILTPAVLIIMVAADLVGIMISSNNPHDKSDRVYISKIVRRTIAAVLVFLVPTFISVIFSLDGVRDVLTADPLCLSRKGTESKAENI